jgi:hypothetical protein
VGKLIYTPWIRINRFEVESEILELSHIRRATFEPNLFGRATVTVEYRQPVAKIAGDQGLYVDSAGDVYVDPVGADVPEVKVPADTMTLSGCLTGSWPRSGVVTTVKEMRSSLPQLDYSLELDPKSVLSLRVVDGPQVILGSASQLEEKIKKLADLYSNEGVSFKKSTVLNLIAPERPTIKD